MPRYRCVCPRSEHRPSQPKWYDLPLVLLLRRPYRCRHCRLRFYRPLWYLHDVPARDPAAGAGQPKGER